MFSITNFFSKCDQIRRKLKSDFLRSQTNLEAFVRRYSLKKDVLKNFKKFSGKHRGRVFVLIKLQASACNFIKKETLAQVFSCQFCEISKNTFFIEHLRATDSKNHSKPRKVVRQPLFMQFQTNRNIFFWFFNETLIA